MMKIPRLGSTARTALTVTALALLPVFSTNADQTKANNTDSLNLGSSWVGGTAPTATDVAVWNNTVTGANSSALGANASWQGIRIVNPGGAVTVTHTAGQSLTLGTAGIDMSAATQNLTLLNSTNIAGSIAIGANQTWNVASGRTLQLFSNSNTQNQALTGSGNIEITGGGIVRVLTGDSSSTGFGAGQGNDTYSGNWTVTNGTLRGLRNGTHAWGTGTITMNGGTLGQEQGNWTWTTNISLATSTTSTFDDFNSSGTNRSLKLQGIISGDGNLNINDSSNRMDADNGFVLTGANTMSGTVTLGANANLRVGGVTGNDTNLAAGTGGTLGTASVNLNATTATLTFSRSNAHTVNNTISGSGAVRVGGGFASDEGQVLTLSGSNTYTGATSVNAGRLHLTGSLTSATTVNSGAAISGTGSATGLLTTASGASISLAGGGSTTSLTSNGVTFANTAGGTTIRFLTAPVAATTYDVVTYGAGALTNFSTTNVVAFAHGTVSNNVGAQKIEFAADGAQTRTWDGVTGTWIQGGTTDLWQEGDQDYFDGDNVVFNEPSAAATVTLSGRLAPGSVTVNNTTNDYFFTGTAGTNDITGTTSLTKNNGGYMAIATQQSYTGGTTVNGGTLDLTGGGGAVGVIRGTATVESGAILRLSTGDATGYNTDSTRLSTINLNGGTLHVNTASNQTLGSATINMTGGSITGIAGSNLDLFANGSAINTLASATTSTISLPTMNLRQNNTVITVTNGAAATDLSISANIGNGDVGNHNLIKEGAGLMALSGTNGYTGTTTVSNGTLELGSTGTLTGTTALTVNTGGTLLLSSASESINNAAGLTLDGGTLAYATGLSSRTETLLSLTLSANSTLDFGTGNTNQFAFTNGITGLGSFSLAVWNWSGPVGDPAQDHLAVGGSALSSSELANVSFYSDAGGTFLGTGLQLGFGSPAFELVPVPEPTTALAGFALLGLAGCRRRRTQRVAAAG